MAPRPVAHPLAQVQYLSEAWAEKALRLMESDPAIRRALHGVRLSLLTIVLAPPKGCYGFLYAAFDERGLADYRVGHDYHAVAGGLPAPTFVVSGRYEVFAAIQKRRLSERQALLTRRLHLTGSMMKALRHMRALETITAVMATIPCKV